MIKVLRVLIAKRRLVFNRVCGTNEIIVTFVHFRRCAHKQISEQKLLRYNQAYQ